MKKSDYIEGKYYYSVNNDATEEYISKYGGKNYFMSLRTNRYTNNFYSYTEIDTNWSVREATLEEANWLEECIRQSQFVPKPIIEQYSIY